MSQFEVPPIFRLYSSDYLNLVLLSAKLCNVQVAGMLMPCVDPVLRCLSCFKSAASGGDSRSTGKTSPLLF